ncbi:MAG: hypothetical protein A2X81_00055 [Desulfobacterales bacterium GWB2_56_26]|nr:MAG: hypothetical protein A2X81_00055 [Desulfobacterales bacterium GWB2_56_26]
MNILNPFFKDETLFSTFFPAEERAGGNYPPDSSTPLFPGATVGHPVSAHLPTKQNGGVHA